MVLLHSLGSGEIICSHLLAGVPVKGRPLEDEPEALPLLGDEDAAVLPLLPQPAVAVGSAQLTAGHTTATQGRRHSCEDEEEEQEM